MTNDFFEYEYSGSDNNDNLLTEDLSADSMIDDFNDGVAVTIRLDSNPTEIQSGISSVIGSRKSQQDAARTDNEYMYHENNVFLAVMCDGMGGMKGGEEASNLCVTKMFEAFYCVDVKGKVPSFFKFMVDNIDKMIHNLTDENGKSLHSGSTMTSVIIEKNSLYWVSVGDSRIYLKRGKEMMCVTVDHNYKMLLDKKVKQGLITQQQADTDPEREALVSYIGMGGVQYIDINPNPFKLINGDCVLLCSDGLYRTLSNDEMMSIMDSYSDIQQAAEALTSLAISKGKKNQDNTTAVILKYIEN